MSREPISLIRTTPPTPSWVGEEFSKAFLELSRRSDLPTLMRTHKFIGAMEDRRAGGLWLKQRFGEELDPDRIIVTNGTQNALFITLATMVGQGGLLLTERLSYYGFRRLATFLGIDVRAIEMDDDGALPEAFEAVCKTDKPKALFLSPTLHNPTTIIMSRERRLALAEIARRYGVIIIEDDVYGLLPKDAPPPIAALAPDVTWHATGLAKCIAPGLRIGYLVAPDAAASARAFQPFNTTSTWFVSPVSAAIVEHWIGNGVGRRILDAVREEAAARQVIARSILGRASYLAKPEALHLWLDLPAGLTQEGFISACNQQGVVLRSGEMFAVSNEQASPAIRIVLGSPSNREELTTALEGVAAVLKAA
ncbi:PLP-dependent aminotransferase family protein [Phyllobacterium zundukense]|uniref:PLP-dependent aminotransferase family protein n=1 Tax=Phyllobacterium zundukense TaxID=1867719 RepID=A0ACD4CV94_9HYPH|nr:PLP-dependent aminotransferase family protein [Phyllobacterium zundukense]UXN57510.1 PLP-dependent aminotransferase family protein [Phyllobacterium zundukense]